jgi:hypothetical protein
VFNQQGKNNIEWIIFLQDPTSETCINSGPMAIIYGRDSVKFWVYRGPCATVINKYDRNRIEEV